MMSSVGIFPNPNPVVMKRIISSLATMAATMAFCVPAFADTTVNPSSFDKELVFVVCYSGQGCYTIEDGSDCVSGLQDDVYYEIGC